MDQRAQYAMTPEREAVLSRHPDYAVDVEPLAGTAVARVGDVEIARSDRALEVRESFHEPVIYFPLGDVDPTRLAPTDHQTRCPFKGDAAYFSLRVDAHVLDNAAWTYPEAMDEVADLRGQVAFYPQQVTVERL